MKPAVKENHIGQLALSPDDRIDEVPLNEAASLMAVIARAASDPAVDVDKLIQLEQMHQRITARQAEQAFNDQMTAAQKQMRRIAADSNNPQTRSKYASYAALDRAIRPVYTEHGFNLTFDTGDGAPEGCMRIICDVSNSGYTRRHHIDMPADGKGAKGADVMTRTHAAGSAVTYGRRYLLAMIFNLAVGEDDDGNTAGDAAAKISEEQIKTLQSLIVEVAADIPRFCKYMKVERIEDIRAKDFDQAVTALEAKRAK